MKLQGSVSQKNLKPTHSISLKKEIFEKASKDDKIDQTWCPCSRQCPPFSFFVRGTAMFLDMYHKF